MLLELLEKVFHSLLLQLVCNIMFYLADKYNEHFPVGVADILGYALPWQSLRKLLKDATLRTASTTDKYVHYLTPRHMV